MELEQVKPNKPNFGLVVAIACSTLLILFLLALAFLTLDGNHIRFRHHSQHPTSQLTAPPAPTRLA